MNLSAMDLNLFVVLHAVLAERSATRAAARLHVTQSAVSNALARLRRVLGDPLVVRTRRGLSPTPRALALQPQLEAALGLLEGVTREAARFDLRATRREWVMAFAELYGSLLLPGLVARVREAAPHCTLRVVSLEHLAATDGLATGEVDLYLGIPGGRLPGLRAEHLFEDELVCVVRKDHPAARRRLTLDAFVALPQVQAKVTPTRGREIDDALARQGFTRNVVLTVPNYGAVFPVVAASDCASAVSRRLALHFAKSLPLRILDLPLELPKLRIALHWHLRADADESVLALRKMVREVLAPDAPSR